MMGVAVVVDYGEVGLKQLHPHVKCEKRLRNAFRQGKKEEAAGYQ